MGDLEKVIKVEVGIIAFRGEYCSVTCAYFQKKPFKINAHCILFDESIVIYSNDRIVRCIECRKFKYKEPEL